MSVNNKGLISQGVCEEVAGSTCGSSSDEGIAASLGLNTQLFVFQLINFAA